MLTNNEITRYKRHLLIKDIGGQGQQRLKAASVLVVGVGGLGSPLIQYLAGAGIGHLGLIDNDTVSTDNLQRQIAFRTEDVGALKVNAAADLCRRINPYVTVTPIAERLTAENAMALISQYDVIADGSDNFATRYLVNDACYFCRKPLVFAALGQLDGYLSTFRAYENDEEGQPRPNYRCVFPEAPPEGVVANCEEAGILGPVAGVLGTLQAVEVIKEVLDLGQSLAGRLLLFDALTMRFETIALKWDPANPLNGRSPSILDLTVHRQTLT